MATRGGVTSPSGKAFADMLSFDTGSGYIFSEITFMQPEFADVVGGVASTCKISFNGEVVAGLKIDSLQEDMTLEARVRLVIPPFTTVLIEGNTATGNWGMYATFTGVVYDV